MDRKLTIAAALLAASFSARAQEADKGQQLLADAAAKMLALDSYAFESTVKTKSPRARGGGRVFVLGGGAGPDNLRVEGTVAGDLLHAEFSKHEVVFAGKRMIARHDDGEWKLRRGKLVNGASLPFVFDPGLFFDAIATSGAKVARTEVGMLDDRPIQILSMTLEGDAAYDLIDSGLLPPVTGGGFSTVAFRAIAVGVGGGGAPPAFPAPTRPELTLDLAVYVDPATRLVHAIKARGYSKNAGVAGAGVVVFGGGAGGAFGVEEEEEEEEDEAADPDAPPKYEDGLRVRKDKHKDHVRHMFDVKFARHGEAAAPDVDTEGANLLRLPQRGAADK